MGSRKSRNSKKKSRTSRKKLRTSSTRTNPQLWEDVKKYVNENYKEYGKWNAYKSAISVKLYKKMGGKYKGSRSPNNSMSKWLREKWTRINSRDKNSRFLPKRVINKMSASLKRSENKRKKSSRRRGESKSKYSPKLNSLMKRMKIY